MKPAINLLIQVEELIEAREQKKATTPNARLAGLDEAIANLMKQLPPELARQFNKLKSKNELAIVPISDGACSGCGIVLPVSMIQAARLGKEVQVCANCARMLFIPPSEIPKSTRPKTRRFEPRQVGIARFSSQALMIPNLAATDRDGAIRELCAHLEEVEFVDNCDVLTELALKREAIISTAVDHGLAFPHVRGVDGGGLTLTLGLSKKGIRFHEDARHLTRIIFFIVIPTAASAFYLKLLAGLSETFAEKATRDKLLKADTPDKLWKTLLTVTRKHIS